MFSLRLSLLRLGGKTYGGCFPDASQMPPRCLPDASQMAPRCLPDVSQMPPRCLPDASQIPPRCLPDVSQMLPRRLPNVSQMPFRCLPVPPFSRRGRRWLDPGWEPKKAPGIFRDLKNRLKKVGPGCQNGVPNPLKFDKKLLKSWFTE